MAGPLAPNLAELVDPHYRAVFGYAYRLTGSVVESEDLTQQTFLLAQANLSQLREPKAARSWLYTIARNEFLRRRPTVSITTLDDVAEPTSRESDLELHVDGSLVGGDLTSEQLQTALRSISPEFRVPLVMFFLEELSYREIAGRLQLPIGTVMSRLSRGKVQLRRKLEPFLCESVNSVGPPSQQPLTPDGIA